MRRALALLLLCACPSAVPDAITESKDTKVRGGTADGYVYVAKRSGATVGLAEARGLPTAEATRVVDRLADGLADCLKSQASRGTLAAGAVRIVAEIDDGGVPGPPSVTMSPGSEASALLCMVAPFRMTQFSTTSSDAGARGIALEATWDAR